MSVLPGIIEETQRYVGVSSGGQYKSMGTLVLSSHDASHKTTDMRSAAVIISLVATIAAEAPYHLPQPAPQAPTFNYPAPAPPQQAPISSPVQPNFGYQYNPASIQRAFVQPAPQSQINYQSQPAPSQPALLQYPVSNVATSIGYNYPQPPPQIDLRQQQPQPRYQPQQQPQPQPQPIRYTQPSSSYGLPQPQIAPRPPLTQSPVQPFTQQPQPQPAQVYQPIAYQQQQSNFQSGYSYTQQAAQSAQSFPQLPLQSQPTSSSQPASYSSYQADSNQYSGVQGQSLHDALDSVVIGRVSNIIKDNEHSSARSAGYQSLVSGVSLGNAQPSLEILSFVQNSPLGPSQNTASFESSSSASASSSGPSPGYGLPTITANSQSTSQDSSSFNFLPQTRPASSYGQPS